MAKSAQQLTGSLSRDTLRHADPTAKRSQCSRLSPAKSAVLVNPHSAGEFVRAVSLRLPDGEFHESAHSSNVNLLRPEDLDEFVL